MIVRSMLSVVLLVCCSFSSNELESLLPSLQTNLQHSLRTLTETNVAKTKLEVTTTGFVRYTETLKSGKQNYASLNLSKFFKMDYLGTSQAGFLVLRAEKKNVIVQTFHDPKGEVDSMSNHLDIPFSAIEPEKLNTIENQLQRIRFLMQQKQ